MLSTSQVASAAPAAARLVSALVLTLALPAAVALLIGLRGRRAPDRRRAADTPDRLAVCVPKRLPSTHPPRWCPGHASSVG